MTGERMQTTRKETRCHQVDKRIDPARLDEDVVEDELHSQIDKMPLRQSLRPDETGTEGIEEDLECPKTYCEAQLARSSSNGPTRKIPYPERCLNRAIPGATAGQCLHRLPQGTCGAPCDISA